MTENERMGQALYEAAGLSSVDEVRRLLDEGADISFPGLVGGASRRFCNNEG
jgi:hypothetical protein